MKMDLIPAASPDAGATTEGRRDGTRTPSALESLAARLPPALAAAVHWHAVTFAGSAPFADLGPYLPTTLQAASGKRRTEYLAGRYCAQQALAKAGVHGHWAPRGGDDLPVWPAGWVGSISHASGGALAAVAHRAQCAVLGVDMERICGDDQLEALRRLVALPGESEVLATLAPRPALTLLFSAKESLYKALYPQVREFFDFSAARAVAFDAQAVTLQLTQAWGSGWPRGRSVRVAYMLGEEQVFTVACEAAPA